MSDELVLDFPFKGGIFVPDEPLRLDLGCGPHPKEGFVGVDRLDFGQPVVFDLRLPWKWEGETVQEVYCAHFLEHLTAPERVHFVNELYRVLQFGGKADLVVPHWSSARAYGDLTHQWPPVSEFWFRYLEKAWRDANAPHTNELYSCDFDTDWGFALHALVQQRNQEFQQFASTFYKEANQDMHFTLWKRPRD